MPISPEAINTFLKREPDQYLPVFKGRDPKHLHDLIRHTSGEVPLTFRAKLRPHQIEGLAFALWMKRSLLYYSMRLGKSAISLSWAQQLRLGHQWSKKGLIICHAPIALSVWESETHKHSDLKVYPVKNQIEELIAALESDADLIVIPWSGLQNIFSERRQNRKGQNKLYPDLEGARILSEAIDLVIIDEIHTAKNYESLRFKLAKEIVRNCKYRLGLTGTPMSRNPYDVWAQCYLIDDGKTLGTIPQFFEAAFGYKKFNPFNGRDEYKFDKKKLPILERKLSFISLSYKLEECQNVPVQAGTIELKMTGDQLTAYVECIRKIISLKNKQKVEIQAVFIRMRQISSGYLPFIDDYGNTLIEHYKNNAKMEWLEDFLETQKGANPAMIIVHEYTETGRLISECLTRNKIKHHWLHGVTKDKPKTVADFQAGKIDAIIVQSATGGMAIDLHRADYMLFYESPCSPIPRQQIEARPLSQARGNRPVLIDDLVCSQVERKILGFLKEGKDLMSEIVFHRKDLK